MADAGLNAIAELFWSFAMPPHSHWFSCFNQRCLILLLACCSYKQSLADDILYSEGARRPRLSWETWQPGDNGDTAFLIVIHEILDADTMMVTPVPRFTEKTRTYPVGVTKLGVMDGLRKGDAVIVRESGEQRRDKRFVLKGIPTNSYFSGAVLSVSGDFAISRAENSESQIICAMTKNGAASPEPRKDGAGISFEETISWKTWRPKTVGRSRLLGKVEKILSASSAVITPLNDDDMLMPLQWKKELNATYPKPPSDARIMDICQSAYDRTFILQSIDTSKLIANSLIRLEGMFLVHADPKSRTPVVRQLTGDDEALAVKRIRFVKEKIPVELKSGKVIELVPEEFVKADDGSFDLRFLNESGAIDTLSLNNLKPKGRSQVRKAIAERNKREK